MAKKWVWPTISLILTVFLISWYMSANTNKPNTENVVPFSAHLNAEDQAEHEQKLKILNEDIVMSSTLNKAEAFNDINKLTGIISYKEAKIKLNETLAEHPHFVYLKWEKDNERVQLGTIPSFSSDEGMQALNDIRNVVMQNQQYISPLVKADDDTEYQVVVSKKNNVTATVYIKQSVIPLVEKHQKNNLRLVPYPLETARSEYETVHANSTEPLNVLTADDNERASHFYDNEVVVKFDSMLTEEQLMRIENEINGSKVLNLNDVYIFKSNSKNTEALMNYFSKTWNSVYSEPHYIYITNTMDNTNDQQSYGVMPNDALFNQYQWNLSQISTPTGWNYSKGSNQVTIAVLDTGVNFSHPDLQARVQKGLNADNANASAEDDVGHGTHVTGIIGAQVDNNEGIAGISWYNNILPVKVLNGSGYGSTYAVAQGIIWATDQGAKVINMSLGNYAQADFLHEAIQYAYNHDVVLIAATGNDNTNRPGYPAAYPEVFAVGATNSNRDRAVFSNYGEYIDVVAPGDGIPSTYLNGQYAALSGTSMATPHVAALAGLIRSINPALNNEQVMDIMRQTATDLGNPGYDIYFGHGEINVEKALALAANYNGTIQSYAKDIKAKANKIIEKK